MAPISNLHLIQDVLHYEIDNLCSSKYNEKNEPNHF